jgi:2-oxoglutarate ferredoxin oxidoreductase subunit alpha
VEAFNIAETYRTPVLLMLDEVVGHMRERLEVPPEGELPLVQRLRTSVKAGVDYHPYLPREDGRLPMSDFGGVHRYNVTGLFHDMWGFPVGGFGRCPWPAAASGGQDRKQRQRDARYKEFYLEDADRILISYGSSARSALHVVKNRRKRGEKLGLLELQTLWPFPARRGAGKMRHAKAVIVVEMNMGQIRAGGANSAVEEPDRVFLANRIDGVLITPTDIRNILRVIAGKGV